MILDLIFCRTVTTLRNLFNSELLRKSYFVDAFKIGLKDLDLVYKGFTQ